MSILYKEEKEVDSELSKSLKSWFVNYWGKNSKGARNCFEGIYNTIYTMHNQTTAFLLDSITSVTQSCPILCNPMNCSTPGLPVHHQLPEFTQTHVHWVSNAIQPSHPLSSPSPAPNPSQHQGLFQWVSSAWDGQIIGVSASTSILPMNTQDWAPLGWTGWISLQSKGLSRVFSNTTVQKHQLFGAQLSL